MHNIFFFQGQQKLVLANVIHEYQIDHNSHSTSFPGHFPLFGGGVDLHLNRHTDALFFAYRGFIIRSNFVGAASSFLFQSSVLFSGYEIFPLQNYEIRILFADVSSIYFVLLEKVLSYSWFW